MVQGFLLIRFPTGSAKLFSSITLSPWKFTPGIVQVLGAFSVLVGVVMILGTIAIWLMQ
jgi:ABC-type uncharacterized transport system permease subunit